MLLDIDSDINICLFVSNIHFSGRAGSNNMQSIALDKERPVSPDFQSLRTSLLAFGVDPFGGWQYLRILR